jgi:hypothetical protein
MKWYAPFWPKWLTYECEGKKYNRIGHISFYFNWFNWRVGISTETLTEAKFDENDHLIFGGKIHGLSIQIDLLFFTWSTHIELGL